jgi:DNA-binding response OmpR family regulator
VRVLLVEDDLALADVVARGLRREAIAVDVAYDGHEALEKARALPYDVVVLDRWLPGVHGDAVCRELCATGAGPRVLMLSAASLVQDRVVGLSLGADDYLVKPFAMAELVARIRALDRRRQRARPVTLHWADVCVDPARRSATRGERDLHLTNREFAVLEELIAAGGDVLSAEMLMERVWDDGLDPFSNIVRVTILTLRRKLGEPPLVETVVGAGYRMVEP